MLIFTAYWLLLALVLSGWLVTAARELRERRP